MGDTDICLLSVAEASDLIARRHISPVEVVEAHLERIEHTEGRLNSFITLMKDEALADARRLEDAIRQGNRLGPLHGIPMGLKDLFYVKGVRATVGSRIMCDFVPATNAAVTERLAAAGAIIIGKLQMHEFALGTTSLNPHHGPAHNPWDVQRVTGGSSGGSGSAVAAGQCMAAMGSDTGGSIRMPSSLCGIVGLKPTFGRVSKHGVYPLSWSLDTVGPMTRTVRDAALVLNAIAGYDRRDPSSSHRPVEDFAATLDEGITGIRTGLLTECLAEPIDPEVKAAVLSAADVLETLGASVDQVSMPVLNHSQPISGTILHAEAAEIHLEHLQQMPDEIGPDVRSRLEAGAMIPAADYVRAQRARRLFNQRVREVLLRFDVLLAPTTPIPAPSIDDAGLPLPDTGVTPASLLSRLTRPFNLGGTPVVSVPCGFTASGLPIGMQLVGRPFDEATVLRVAHAYEQATEWHERRPAL